MLIVNDFISKIAHYPCILANITSKLNIWSKNRMQNKPTTCISQFTSVLFDLFSKMIASSCKQNFSRRLKHEIHTTESEAYSEPSQASKMALRKKICRDTQSECENIRTRVIPSMGTFHELVTNFAKSFNFD